MAYHKKTYRKRGRVSSKKSRKTQRSKRGGYDIETGPSELQLAEEGRSVSPPPQSLQQQQPQSLQQPQPQSYRRVLDANTQANAAELGQTGFELDQNGGKRRTKKRSAKRRSKSRKVPKVCLMCKKSCKTCKCINCKCPTCRVGNCRCRKSMMKRLLGI